jgi:exopolysaccharide production protein ExoZ
LKLLRLQVVRGIAANLVVLQHLWEFDHKYAGALFPIFVRYADLGVDVFFVLSGFVMAAVAGRDIGPLQFLWRRAARIYPTYWLATLIMLATFFLAPGLVHEPIDALPWWRSFLLVAASPKQPIVSAGWTLVHEVYFYIVFAAFLAMRIPIMAGVVAWGGAILLAAMLIPAHYFASSPVLAMMSSPLTFEFMMGTVIGVLWTLYDAPSSRMLGMIGGGTLVVSILVHYHFFATDVAIFDNSESLRVVMFGVPIAFILYAVVAREREASGQPSGLLVALGDWSYSTYLLHFMALSAVGRTVHAVLLPGHPIGATAALMIVGFLAANLAGAAMYGLFERPTLGWLGKLGRPNAPSSTMLSSAIGNDAAVQAQRHVEGRAV